MTQPHPQRCDHECVCGRYLATAIIYKSPCPAGSDIYESCTHDTRATHTPAAPATESKFTCWRGDCKLHDDCIHSYGQEYPPCVGACAMQARRAGREKTIREMLKHFKFSCPGGKITPICDLCGANPYCIELRGGATEEGGERR